jgi:pimeloyl-ACP methyl ester carboxylesterase
MAEHNRFDPTKCIFLHGLEGSSRGVKATLLRELFPGIQIPDFRGSLSKRMKSLYEVLGDEGGWTIIGSSFGGLLGALFTCERPEQVRKLVLFAPALIWPDFASSPPTPVAVPTLVYHGARDEIVPLEPVRQLAEAAFQSLDFRVVDDDHGLYQTVHQIDWPEILS